MPLNAARVNEVADAAQRIAERLLDVFADVDDFLEFQSDQAIGWTDDPRPAYISVDPGGSGNLEGRNFSPANVANLIGSLAAVRTLLTGGSLTGLQGDHLGNLNVVARPVGKR